MVMSPVYLNKISSLNSVLDVGLFSDVNSFSGNVSLKRGFYQAINDFAKEIGNGSVFEMTYLNGLATKFLPLSDGNIIVVDYNQFKADDISLDELFITDGLFEPFVDPDFVSRMVGDSTIIKTVELFGGNGSCVTSQCFNYESLSSDLTCGFYNSIDGFADLIGNIGLESLVYTNGMITQLSPLDDYFTLAVSYLNGLDSELRLNEVFVAFEQLFFDNKTIFEQYKRSFNSGVIDELLFKARELII